MKRRWLLATGLLLGTLAQAQSVALAGRMGDRALLVVDGKAQTVGIGQTAGGVRLLRWLGDEAEVELGGKKTQLRVGGTPTQVGAGARVATGREIVMTAGSGGHFTPSGSINGKAVSFMVDTGATLVAMGLDDAQRLGLDLKSARAGMSQTANGPVRVLMVTLDRVRVGDVELNQVAAVVLPQAMPFVLLGNSFLTRFQMRRDNDVMRLELR
jgi:aspartyl protease family protein